MRLIAISMPRQDDGEKFAEETTQFFLICHFR